MADSLLKLRVTPRGSKNQIVGWRGEVLCVKVTAPPVEGSANSAVVKFLSSTLKVRKNQIQLVSGEKSREKTFRITGLSQADLKNRLS